MKLELRKIMIKDIQFDQVTTVRNDILYINSEEIEALVKSDNRIKEVRVDIARPGESVRIVPVKDVIEPRAKICLEAFPGVDGKIQEVGSGITYALKNCTVVTTGPIVGFQEGIIDMTGPLADYTPFAHTYNVVLRITKADDVTPHEHEEAVRIAGVKAAHYLGKSGIKYDNYIKEDYRWEAFHKKAEKYPGLPKVVYVYNCMSQGLLHDTYFYGRDTKKMITTPINPLEVFDGAIVSGNCVSPGSKTTTFHHQNNAIIEECFKRDGKEINFIGVVLNPLAVTLGDKMRNVHNTVKLVEMMGADGVVQSCEGFGNPTTDVMLIFKLLEERSIKTVLITNEDAGIDGKSEPLPDGNSRVDAIITTGNANARIHIPKMDKVIGDLKYVRSITGGFPDSYQEDGSLIIEIHGIMGVHNMQGYSHFSATTI